MKHLVTIAFISACLFSFGQSNMYWNNYSNFNPAMSGLQYSQHASATYTNYYPALSGNYSNVFADLGIRLGNYHGVGVVYSGDFYGTNYQKVLLNYNYLFNLKKAGKLTVGSGVGIGRSKPEVLYPGGTIVYPEPRTTFELNLGVAYAWKNLYLGFSAMNLTPPEQDPLSSYYTPRTGYNVHVQYAFQIAEKFQLTQRLLYTYQDGFQRLEPNLTLSYLQKFHLGISSELRNDIGVNIGWDIKNKFRLAYMYDVSISKLNNGVSGGVHEFTLGYLLKK